MTMKIWGLVLKWCNPTMLCRYSEIKSISVLGVSRSLKSDFSISEFAGWSGVACKSAVVGCQTVSVD